MKKKLELFIENKHSELRKVMDDTKISNFLEKNELDEIYDDRFLDNKPLVMKFLEILLCMYFQHKGEKAIMKIKIEKLEKEISELRKRKSKEG